MRLEEFRDLVRRQATSVPPEFFDGVFEVTVSPRTLPHPTRAEIYTLGECIPMPVEDPGPEGVQSRVVLYHGSFQALARLDPGFDWAAESWDTLTHELRHHVEWRAHAPNLEAYDDAAEQNFARQDGEPFDPAFYRDGESPAPGVYRVEDDFFLEQVVHSVPKEVKWDWHGSAWHAEVPRSVTLPAFLTIDGLADPPPGELILVLRRRPRFRDLFARTRAPVFQATIQAQAELGSRP